MSAPGAVVIAVVALPGNVGAQRLGRAEQTGLNIALEVLNGIAEGHLETDTQLAAGSCDCLANVERVLQNGCKRLFAEYVCTVLEREQALLLVQMNGACDEHQIGAIDGEKVFGGAVHGYTLCGQLCIARNFLVKRVDGRDQLVAFGIDKALEQSQTVVAVSACTDDCQFNGFHTSSSSFPEYCLQGHGSLSAFYCIISGRAAGGMQLRNNM